MRVLLAVVFLVVAIAVFAFWHQRHALLYRLRRRFGRDRPRHPVVLVHGLMGFDEIAKVEYFRGIRERLEAAGVRVVRVRLPPLGSVQARAKALVQQLEGVEGRLNIIAHSMGGLDARHALTHLGLAPRVASLVTIGTPHRGTPVAHLGAGAMKLGLGKVAKLFGLEVAALADLTPTTATSFNGSTPDVRGVFYASVVAEAKVVHPLLKPVHLVLSRKVASDGLVPVDSQSWGFVLRRVEADHWAQIGWSKNGVDAPSLFEELTRELAWRGF